MRQSFFTPVGSNKTIFQYLDDAAAYMLESTAEGKLHTACLFSMVFVLLNFNVFLALVKGETAVSYAVDFDETKVVAQPASWIFYYSNENPEGSSIVAADNNYEAEIAA